MRISLLLTLSLLPLSAFTQTLPQPPAALYGTYSSYKFIPESGDIIGVEIVILPGSRHPQVVFECAEGAPSEPVLAAAKVTDKTLNFDVPADNMCSGHYQVFLAPTGIRLTGGKAKLQTIVARHKSYWAPR